MTAYQFVILRYVHSATAQEFVNIGVLMWVPTEKRALFKVNERYSRLSGFFQGFDGAGYRSLTKHLVRRFARAQAEIAGDQQLTLYPERPTNIREVTQPLSPDDASVFQWSEVLGGIADDPAQRVEQLFQELVERFETQGPRARRDEAEFLLFKSMPGQ